MDNLNARAELEVIVTGLDKAVAQFEQLYEATGDKQFDKYGRSVAKVSGQLKGAASEAGTAAKATDGLKVAQQGANDATEQSISTLPRLRYALYDVATTAGVMSAAIVGAGAAVSALSANFESGFTSVERTLEPGSASVEGLREQLMQLTREIPLTFAEITKIATLGNQLGIAGSDVAAFTETVARFSAITGVSVEEAGKAFGAMQYSLKVPASEFENLSSAIALVGRSSVATEPEILSLVREIGTQANQAGFAADQVVALAGTLGQLRVPPERARGSLTTYFQTLNKAVAEGGEKLDLFARIIGVTSSQLDQMVRSGQGVEVFERFTKALGGAGDVVQVTQALDALGLAQLRVSDVFQRLSSNAGTFTDFLAIGKQGYDEGSESARQYAMVVDDLASRWQIFLNSVSEAGAAVGDALAPGLKVALDMISQTVQALGRLASTPFGQWAVGISATLAGIVAVLGLLVTGAALSIASMAAFKTALVSLNITSGASIFTMRGLSAAVGSVGAAMGLSAAGVHTFKVALASTGIGLAVVALGTLAAAFMTTGDAAANAFDQYVGTTAGLAEAVAADTEAHLDGTARAFSVLTPATLDNAAANDDNARAIHNVNSILGTTMGQIDGATGALDNNTIALGANTQEWIRAQLRQSEAFKEFANNGEMVAAFHAIGASFDELSRVALSADPGQAQQAIAEYFYAQAKTAYEAGNATIEQISQVNRSIAFAINNGWTAKEFSAKSAGAAGGLSNTFGGVFKGIINQIALLPPAARKAGTSTAGSFGDITAAADKAAKAIGGGGGGGRRGGGGGVAAQIRTLVDYANDLSGVFKRAFDIRFGGGQAMDSITSSWSKIAKAIADARDEMAGYRTELQGIASDRAIKKYWLMVAENYGDTLRAGKLRAELADLDKKQAETQKKLTAAQAKTNKTLEGNSDAAIENRGEILGLVGNYQSYLTALASSGMSQADLQAKSAQLRAEFVQQAVRMGYNRAEVEKYAAAFDDMATAIDRVPRNITVSANTNPAIQALNEFIARANNAKANVQVGGGGGGYGMGQNFAADFKQGVENFIGSRPIAINGYLVQGQQVYRVPGTSLKMYRSGGYTGDGGVNQPAGIVHGKEFVMSAPAVRNAGGPNAMAYLHSALRGGHGLGSMGAGAAGAMSLTAATILQLARAIAAAQGPLSISAAGIAGANNGYNANESRRGNG